MNHEIKRVECLKVDDNLYQIGDIVEVTLKPSELRHNHYFNGNIIRGRIDRFTPTNPDSITNTYTIRLDISTLYNVDYIDILISDIHTVSSVKTSKILTSIYSAYQQEIVYIYGQNIKVGCNAYRLDLKTNEIEECIIKWFIRKSQSKNYKEAKKSYDGCYKFSAEFEVENDYYYVFFE